MKIFIIQSGTYQEDGTLQYSITSKRQVASLQSLGIEVGIGLVTGRTSLQEIRANIRRLKVEVKAFNPDLIHAHYGSVVGLVASRIAAKTPLVVSFCGDDLLGTPNPGLQWRVREKLARQLSLRAASKARWIIIKSQNLKMALPKRLRKKASVVPNGVNSEFFAPMSKRDCRKAMEWGSEPVIFFNGSSGTNAKVKNLELALKTLEQLKKAYPNARLESVSQVSPRELKIRMCASDCVLVTSLHEGSPNIVKEAMACNIPVVSVNCGDVTLRLRGVTKGGVYPYDPEKLAEGIIRVLRNHSKFNGRELFLHQGLAEHEISGRILEVYQRAIYGKETFKTQED